MPGDNDLTVNFDDIQDIIRELRVNQSIMPALYRRSNKKKLKIMKKNIKFSVGDEVMFIHNRELKKKYSLGIDISSKFRIKSIDKKYITLHNLNINGVDVKISPETLITEKFMDDNKILTRGKSVVIVDFNNNSRNHDNAVKLENCIFQFKRTRKKVNIHDDWIFVSKKDIKKGDTIKFKNIDSLIPYNNGSRLVCQWSGVEINNQHYKEHLEGREFKINNKNFLIDEYQLLHIAIDPESQDEIRLNIPLSFFDIVKFRKEPKKILKGDIIYVNDKLINSIDKFRVMDIIGLSSKKILGVKPVGAISTKIYYTNLSNCRLIKNIKCKEIVYQEEGK